MELKQNKLEHINSSLTITKGKELPAGEFEAILSTDDLDRHGEVVSIKGMTIPTDQVFKIYYNHETTGANLPIGQWTKIWKSADGKLKGRGKIDLLDDFEIKIDKKIKLGTLDSISIGFCPQEYDGETSTWTKSMLVEASVVAEPANTNARVTSKALGFTEEEFNESLKVKLQGLTPTKQAFMELAHQHLIAKGAVADELNQKDKWEEMEDFWEVVYAFADAYNDPAIKPGDFNTLLTECISILQTIVDGTYQYEDEADDQGSSDGASFTEMKSIITQLKSRVGAVENTLNASAESPAIKTLIKLRVAAKEVDKAAETLNKAIKVTLKGTN